MWLRVFHTDVFKEEPGNDLDARQQRSGREKQTTTTRLSPIANRHADLTTHIGDDRFLRRHQLAMERRRAPCLPRHSHEQRHGVYAASELCVEHTWGCMRGSRCTSW